MHLRDFNDLSKIFVNHTQLCTRTCTLSNMSGIEKNLENRSLDVADNAGFGFQVELGKKIRKICL